ncbi:uncharacterized protein METZ01_LOCUS343111 [marine metagenome]|uniref:Uncharacterized protein n=1 Tax=marine metagenome TaxID=408172 RepID=A0A382QZ56_9ZZZZ
MVKKKKQRNLICYVDTDISQPEY